MSGRDVVKRLQREGWAVDRQRGSHVMLEKDGRTVAVPVHGNRDLGKGLIADLERQTGVKLR